MGVLPFSIYYSSNTMMPLRVIDIHGAHHLQVHARGTASLISADTATIRIRTPYCRGKNFSFFCLKAEHFIYTINRAIGTFRGETTCYTPLQAAVLSPLFLSSLLSRPVAGPFILSGGNSRVHILPRAFISILQPINLLFSGQWNYLHPANYPRLPNLLHKIDPIHCRPSTRWFTGLSKIG